MNSSPARLLTIVLLIAALGLVLPASGALGAKPVQSTKQPTATGTGGAVATVDHDASQVGMQVLKEGGNAVDAAVATAAALGVTEPYSCGIGGGGFMVIYDAESDSVSTIDSRETAPAAFQENSFLENGQPIPIEERVTSGLGVGVPGTIDGWEQALGKFGSRPLSELLQPSIRLAARGFVVDQTYRQQTSDNLARFEDFTSTRETFLRNGQPPAVGSTFRNPDLAATYSRIADGGGDAFYSGRTARAIVETVKDPPVDDPNRNVRPGLMETSDLSDYHSIERAPTESSYRGMQVYGMGPPSSGGSTVGEALNILEGYSMSDPLRRNDALHRYLEASRYSFADRGKYLGDPAYVDVPLTGLLSDEFAADRRELITEEAAEHPVAPGNPCPYNGGEPCPSVTQASTAVEGPSTTHLTVSDESGNIVSYTFTIEQTGGSAITVPRHGFILNNELTDFEPMPGLANSPDGGKRPRSSMSPTIVTDTGDDPILALGSPGGSTIITTVLQVLVNDLDFGMTLPEAIAAPRASQRNTATTSAEPDFLTMHEAALSERGHSFTSTPEIGAATGIAFLPGETVQAAAEPVRRGGGSALVENPAP